MAARRSSPDDSAPKRPAKKAASAKRAPAKKRRGSSEAEHRAHTPEDAGSKPAPASRKPARVAQKAERLPRKEAAAGSTPAPGSTPISAALLAAKARIDAVQAPEAPLTLAEESFLSEYLRNGGNGTAAWMFAHPGCLPTTAAVEASKCIRKPRVAARLAAERARLRLQHQMDRDALLQELLAIVRADPNELMQVRQVACASCWGGNRGDGLWVEPDPECGRCGGDGVQVPWFADTRRLSPEARALFAGVRQTREGIQILIHNKLDALDRIAKIIGAYEEDNRQKGQGLTDAVRAFFAGLHGQRLPIAKPQPLPAPTNPLVREASP